MTNLGLDTVNFALLGFGGSVAAESHWCDDSRVTETRRNQWERSTEWILTGSAILFLSAYAVPILWPELQPMWMRLCRWVVIATWFTFAIDYAARLILSVDRWRFVKTNLIDLLVVALPLFRPLRLLRLVTCSASSTAT